ncbi:JAB domain-containing protein [Emergencia sp. 1XD21-10]|uniref:JAB domain-containing protein n=1 Tax=Emergencia sp. 1XD21-10 TaxID=2304569 RepID=UPI00137B74DE|nr:JAB domain-containing protein [Emergencia sp. 1XD21-10]NCE98118.1 hypothetical protein [Emergencia sp. 1XD21-10]
MNSFNEKTRLFLDIDGTLAVFTPVDTMETLYEKGYFENLAPHENVIEGVKLFLRENPETEVFVLSSVLADSLYAEEEKQKWLDKYLPEIDAAHRLFPPCGQDKADYVPGGIRNTDILLDDYSLNLHAWNENGAGIKLLNGINGTKGSWRGAVIDYLLSPETFCEELSNSIELLTKERMFDIMKATNLRELLKEYHKEYEEEGEELDYAEMAIKSIETGREDSRIPDARNSAAMGSGTEIKTIGKAISDRYIKEGGINFIGETIESPAQLAGLFQCYRNPLYETFRILYLKDQKLIAAEGVSNHLPGLCYVGFDDKKPLQVHVKDRMEALEADSYYFVHNHPTGDPTPSMQDILMTRVDASPADGFAGHIVLDHTEFSLINADGSVEKGYVSGALGEDVFHTAEMEHPLLNTKIKNRDEMAEIGRKLIDENEQISYLVYTNSIGNIQLIQEVSNELILRTEEFEKVYQESLINSGCITFFCITTNEDVFEAMDNLYVNKSITDAIFLDPDYYPFYWSKTELELERDDSYIFPGVREEDLAYYYENDELLTEEKGQDMHIRKIENGNSAYTVLDEMQQDSGKQRLLLIRDSDGAVVIAHGWNEENGSWDHGSYYDSKLTSLGKAITAFEEYRLQEQILANDRVLREATESEEKRITALVHPIEPEQVYIAQLDEKSRENIERAVRDFEALQGFTGDAAEAYIKEVLADRIHILSDAIQLIESDILPEHKISFERGKEWYQNLAYEEKWSLLLSEEFPEIEHDKELVRTLYETYQDSEHTGFLGNDLRSELETEIEKSKFSRQKEKSKEKGVELG